MTHLVSTDSLDGSSTLTAHGFAVFFIHKARAQALKNTVFVAAYLH